jgi:hypothetical protein
MDIYIPLIYTIPVTKKYDASLACSHDGGHASSSTGHPANSSSLSEREPPRKCLVRMSKVMQSWIVRLDLKKMEKKVGL